MWLFFVKYTLRLLSWIFFLNSTVRACSPCCWMCSRRWHCHLLLWKSMSEVAGLVRVCWVNHLMEHDIVRHLLSFIYGSLIFSLTFLGCYHLLINSPGTMSIFNVLWLYCKPLPLYYSDAFNPGLKEGITRNGLPSYKTVWTLYELNFLREIGWEKV